MEFLTYLVLQFSLLGLFMAVTFPIPVLCFLALHYLDQDEGVWWFKCILVLVALAYLFGLRWLASRVAQRMAFNYESFWPAVKSALSDLRFRLALLPLVGHWFYCDQEKPEEEPPDQNSKRP